MKPVEAKDIYTYDWVFEVHPPEELRRWITSLKYVSFIRAFGGHASDYDEFVVYLRFSDEADLLALMNALGVELKTIGPDTPVPEPGVSYSGDTWATLASPIAEFPTYDQPGMVEVNGIPVYLSVAAGCVGCVFSGADPNNGFDVTELDYSYALQFDAFIESAGLADRVDTTLQERAGCMTIEKVEALIRTNETS